MELKTFRLQLRNWSVEAMKSISVSLPFIFFDWFVTHNLIVAIQIRSLFIITHVAIGIPLERAASSSAKEDPYRLGKILMAITQASVYGSLLLLYSDVDSRVAVISACLVGSFNYLTDNLSNKLMDCFWFIFEVRTEFGALHTLLYFPESLMAWMYWTVNGLIWLSILTWLFCLISLVTSSRAELINATLLIGIGSFQIATYGVAIRNAIIRLNG